MVWCCFINQQARIKNFGVYNITKETNAENYNYDLKINCIDKSIDKNYILPSEETINTRIAKEKQI